MLNYDNLKPLIEAINYKIEIKKMLSESVILSVPMDKSAQAKFNKLDPSKSKAKTNENFRIMVRTKAEMIFGMGSRGTHSCAIKFGYEGPSLKELKVGGTFAVIDGSKRSSSKSVRRRTPDEEVVARRFAQDNEAAILAFWNADDNEQVRSILRAYFIQRVKDVNYRNDKSIRAKSPKELEDSKAEILEYLRKELNDPDFDISFSSRP